MICDPKAWSPPGNGTSTGRQNFGRKNFRRESQSELQHFEPESISKVNARDTSIIEQTSRPKTPVAKSSPSTTLGCFAAKVLDVDLCCLLACEVECCSKFEYLVDRYRTLSSCVCVEDQSSERLIETCTYHIQVVMLFGCVAGMSTAFGHLAGHVTAGNFLNPRVSCDMKTEAKTLILLLRGNTAVKNRNSLVGCLFQPLPHRRRYRRIDRRVTLDPFVAHLALGLRMPKREENSREED
ncbi:predicted protein [Histoplasma capsulatum H143]|uniref:Uncharacterized protein n=1 Tax=Ajellomyces capsulatus (strain H143) TaxID=544712 RepID=C6HNZ0_AJECH|nr:predicted protein [Histoplasma capsulatum H143]